MNADVTQMNAERQVMNTLSRKVIGAAQTVSTRLGYGFLEKVYENALAHEVRKTGFRVIQQQPVHVLYDGEIVGNYLPDIMVEDALIVEIKAIAALNRIHRHQCLNYLRATDRRLCLLLNFGRPHLEIAGIVWQF
jgi:GxxExxY protein